MAFSCMNCTERSAGCHSTCEKYINERAELDEQNARKRKEQLIRVYVNNSVSKNLDKNARKKRTKPNYKIL